MAPADFGERPGPPDRAPDRADDVDVDLLLPAYRVEGQPRRPFVYRNLGDMATIGRASAVADFGWLTLKGYIGWLAWLFVHIVKLIGFRNRIVVVVQWAWSYFSYQRAIRLITGSMPEETHT